MKPDGIDQRMPRRDIPYGAHPMSTNELRAKDAEALAVLGGGQAALEGIAAEARKIGHRRSELLADALQNFIAARAHLADRLDSLAGELLVAQTAAEAMETSRNQAHAYAERLNARAEAAERERDALREAHQEILAHHANDNARPKAFYISAEAPTLTAETNR